MLASSGLRALLRPSAPLCLQAARGMSSQPDPQGIQREFSVRPQPDSPLSNADLDSYEQNGYLLVKGLLGPREIDTVNTRFSDLANGRVKYSGMVMMKDIELVRRAKKTGERLAGEQVVTKLQDWVHDEVLFGYCKLPQILAYVKAFAGYQGAKAIHTMYINKPPDLGQGSSRHPLHQDLWYFPLRPCNRIVAAWTALEHIDRTNGCLVVCPGSHRSPLHVHEYPDDGIVNRAYHGIQGMTAEATAEQQEAVIMEPGSATWCTFFYLMTPGLGDTIFFHPLLIHGSGRNSSTRNRKAISCHYAGAECRYVDLAGTIQEPIVQEILDMAIKQYGMPASTTFNQIWRGKSRTVYGTMDTCKDAL